LAFNFNGTHQNVRQISSASSPYTTLTGFLGDPPRFRLRSGAALVRGGFSTAVFANFTSSEALSIATPDTKIGSFTTFDLQFSYQLTGGKAGSLNGTRISIGALNIFDRNPPLIPQAAGPLYLLATGGYDGANASPYGRIITATLSA